MPTLTLCCQRLSLAALCTVSLVMVAPVLPVVAGGTPDAFPQLADSSAEAVASQVDELIRQSLTAQDAVPTAPVNDEDFLRRVTLDLGGRIPTPEEVAEFRRAPEDIKRVEAIERMLESEGFAETWASYWSEVIFSRATDIRSKRTQGVFEEWMAEQLEANRPWDEIVTDLLIATGNTSEVGNTGLIFAHGGDAAELAGETSRIFLGIQIQCANCHDHPYDAWKREDFHELAAFFPRIRIRREDEGKKRTFVVESNDRARGNNAPPPNLEKLFQRLDRDQDGMLTVKEAQRNQQFGKQIARLIKRGDKDSDGALSRAELDALPKRPQNVKASRAGEYFMPDLEDPAAPGTQTQPVFFINEQSVPFGTKDVDRRTALAESIVSTENPWFARAFVNRIWAAMLGEGFYTPVDDMGPERTAQLPQVLDTLAAGFVANDYDIKWLYRTIALTEAYQRALPNSEADGTDAAFAAMSPTRLRGDQIYNAVTQILGVEDLKARGMRQKKLNRDKASEAVFSLLFNYDPSTPQEDLMGNIPQALFMMNSPVTNGAVNGRRGTVLARTLREFEDDSEALNEIYQIVLSRKPTEAEVEICRQHIADVGDRAEAFEDIMWSLLNSSEFLTKR